MGTNLEIAPKLLKEAVEVGRHPTKKAAVEAALTEYVNRRKQLEITKFFGEVDFDENYDYKEARQVPCK